MTFTVVWAREGRDQFDALVTSARTARESRQLKGKTKTSRAEGLAAQVAKCVRLLEENPRHPGLKTHPFFGFTNPHDPKGKVFEAYAQNNTPGAYRVFWCYGPGADQITIIAITPHP